MAANKGTNIPTMAEMAKELGLSRMTISRIINGRSGTTTVAPETEKRVKAYLAKRGYVPSGYARGLKRPRGRVIGLLYVDELRAHLVEAFNLLTKKFNSTCQHLELMVASHGLVESAVRELVARRVTDLVWVNNFTQNEEFRNPEVLRYLINMRTVVYNYYFDATQDEAVLINSGISLVGINRAESVRKLGIFLHRAGHRRVMMPALAPDAAGANYLKTVFAEAGLDVIPAPWPHDIRRVIAALTHQKVTAAYYHADDKACKAICELRANGVRIPEDLTVVGFDGMSRAYNGELTTIAIPIDAMVERVAEILGGSQLAARHCFDLELIKGKTHGAPSISAIRT